MDKESINEHIRNGLSPIKVVLEILSHYKENNQDKQALEFAFSQIDICKKSILRLCELGKNSYEEDENLWANSYYIDTIS